jgi:tripartite-type tricarboxylate transporter receptor subunit TctC
MIGPFVRIAAAFLALVAAPLAQAQSPEEFYKGKTVTIIVGAGPGGGYDTIARVVQKHLANHMPGKPTIVVQNMPGGGGLRAPNYLYTVAEKNGTFIGLIQNSMPFEPMIGNKNATFDPTKFGWLGSPNVESGVLMVWHTAPALTVKDLREKEINVGVEAIASNPALSARLLMQTLGLKLKLIPGYTGSSAVLLAMEKGEVHAFPNFFNSMMAQRPDWLRDKKIAIPVKWGPINEKSLPDVPYAEDIAPDEKSKTILRAASGSLALGRPFLAPPDIPADRLEALRKAFMATFNDPAFVEDSRKIGFAELQPQSGEALEKVIKEIAASPPDVLEQLKFIFTGEK